MAISCGHCGRELHEFFVRTRHPGHFTWQGYKIAAGVALFDQCYRQQKEPQERREITCPHCRRNVGRAAARAIRKLLAGGRLT